MVPGTAGLDAGARASSYDHRTALAVPGTVRALVRAVVVLLAAYLVIYFYAPRYELPRQVALYVLWEGALLTLGWRLVYIWFVTHLPLDRHLLILGASAAGRTVPVYRHPPAVAPLAPAHMHGNRADGRQVHLCLGGDPRRGAGSCASYAKYAFKVQAKNAPNPVTEYGPDQFHLGVQVKLGVILLPQDVDPPELAILLALPYRT